jgi:alpha-glucosidase (family GH31 glycosyl hydrolase)
MLSTYTDLTGCPSIPPSWALGLWPTEFPQEGEQTLLDHLEALRARHIPLDTAFLDYHWEERFDNFRWRAAFFPDPAHLSERLRALGVRLGLIFTPFLNMRHGRLKKRIFNLYVNSVPRERMMDDERELQGPRAACSATGRRSRFGSTMPQAASGACEATSIQCSVVNGR